jgi:phytoene desaturase
MSKQAVVIGAGIAGIASSIRLSVKGYAVTVVEKNNYPGGKITEVRSGDFRFDAGPSLFTMPQYVEELFELAGKNPSDYFQYEKLNEVCRYFWNDGTHFVASGDNEKFAKEAESFFNVSEREIRQKLEKASFIERTAGKQFLEKSLHNWKGFVSKETVKAIFKIPQLGINKTLHEANRKSFRDPKLVQLFDRYATYNGSNPYQTPGIMEVIPHYEYNVGAFFPQKGMVDIVNALVRLADELGVRFVYNELVHEISYANRIVKGVTLASKKKIDAEVVVSNMDAFYTYTKLLPELESPKKRLAQERSSSALIFYWGVNKQFDQLGLHNIFFADNYKAEFEALFESKKVFDDPTVYIHISSKIKKDDAPSGNENWFVMVNTPPKENVDWKEYVEQTRSNVVRKLSDRLNVSLEDLIVSEEMLTPGLIESKTMSYQGSLYGTASNSKYAAFLRQPNFEKRLNGLYFVGGSAHPGGGIPLCLLSAKIAVDHVV